MGAVTLLIADSDEFFCNALSLALQESYYVRTCSTGTQALKLLRESPSSILLLDLMLAEMDGLTLLKTLSQEGLYPSVLVLSPDFPLEVCDSLEQMNVFHLLRKPCRLSSIVEHLRQLRENLERKNILPTHTRQLLQQLNLRPTYDGYPLLLFTLPALAEDPRLTFTKHLYPDAAKAFQCTPKQVERNIRTIIKNAWDPNHDLWRKFFPHCVKRPSNGLFLQRLAVELRKNLE